MYIEIIKGLDVIEIQEQTNKWMQDNNVSVISTNLSVVPMQDYFIYQEGQPIANRWTEYFLTIVYEKISFN